MRGLCLAATIACASSAQAQNGPVDLSNGVIAPLTGLQRTLAARAGDVFNVRDFGALGTGTATTIGSVLGTTGVTDTPNNLASYSAPNGSHPFSWASDPRYGLTFPITASGVSGSTLTFTETLSGGVLAYSATVALWQDPANGNMALIPGMQVTAPANCALPDGTLVGTIQRDPFVSMATYGQVTLVDTNNNPVSSTCQVGTVFTFTISPNQLEARTIDWLGWQAALAQAYANPASGAEVYGPAGNYQINGEIINPAGITDSNDYNYAVHVHGAGRHQTRLNVIADLGTDFAVFKEGNRGYGDAEYSDMTVFNQGGWTRHLGQFPYGNANGGGSDGFAVGGRAYLHDMAIGGFHAAMSVVYDHGQIERIDGPNNGYGLYFAPYSPNYGDWPCTLCGLSGDTVAGIGVSALNAVDGSTFTTTNTGFGPHGIVLEPLPPNATSAAGGNITNSVFNNVFIEDCGDEWIYGPTHDVSNNVFLGGAFAGVVNDTSQQIPNGSGGYLQAKAVAFIANFNNNTLFGTNWGAYSGVTDAVISASGNITGNVFVNDVGLIFNATASLPPLRAGSHVQANRFVTAAGSGVFLSSPYSSFMSPGVAVQDTGNNVLLPYADGKPFAGLTASPIGSSFSGYFGIVNESSSFQPAPRVGAQKADPTQACNQGQPVFATTGGIACGIDQTDAIGSMNLDLGATGIIDLDPGQRGGAKGAATIAAAGDTQATATPITSSLTVINGGSGGISLPPIPIGQCLKLFNQNNATVNEYPPTGASINGLGANNPFGIPQTSSTQVCRNTSATWVQ